jgi:hypothetical protein
MLGFVKVCGHRHVRLIELSIYFDLTVNIGKGFDFCRVKFDQMM